MHLEANKVYGNSTGCDCVCTSVATRSTAVHMSWCVRVVQGKKQPHSKQQLENTKPPAGKPVVPKLPLPSFADAEDLHGFTGQCELMRL